MQVPEMRLRRMNNAGSKFGDVHLPVTQTLQRVGALPRTEPDQQSAVETSDKLRWHRAHSDLREPLSFEIVGPLEFSIRQQDPLPGSFRHQIHDSRHPALRFLLEEDDALGRTWAGARTGGDVGTPEIYVDTAGHQRVIPMPGAGISNHQRTPEHGLDK